MKEKAEIKRFEDLTVFQKAYQVSLEIHQMSLELPRYEQTDLASQMRRASKGVCGNIAEGFGKQSVSKAEFRRYLLMAMGSADEMRVWIRYAFDLGYIQEPQWQRWSEAYRQIAKMLTGLHKSWQ